jgi:hypothetical protein
MSNKTSKIKPASNQFCLFIEVRQAGVVQADLLVPSGPKKREIVFGSRKNSDLWIELAKIPDAIKVFFCDGGKFGVFLEPRIDGFVNTGSEFGSVSEFLKPRGALAKLAAIADPYRVKLDPGARGVLKIGDFDILFKVEKPLPPERQRFFLDGAASKLFEPIQMDSESEKWARYLGFIFASLIFVPLIVWLVKAPHYSPASISQMSPKFLQQFVHPDHFRYLPKIYGLQYSPDHSVEQAVEWITQLQARWNAEETGQKFNSSIPILKDFVRTDQFAGIEESWKEKVTKTQSEIEQNRTSKQSPRYYQFQKKSPVIVTTTAGAEKGSLYVRQLNRIQSIEASYGSMKTLVLAEQKFLNDYYAERGFDAKEQFKAPHKADAKNVETSQEFETEKKLYAAADGWVQLANQSRFFSRSLAINSDEQTKPTVAWLEKSGFIAPAFAMETNQDSLTLDAQQQDDLINNIKYALNLMTIPPPPLPTPVLNRAEVDAVILDRREEIRGCYEDALRREGALQGSLKVAWWIGTNGKARDIQLGASNLRHERLMSCMRNLILSWNFPKPRYGAVKVEYPFRFVVEK